MHDVKSLIDSFHSKCDKASDQQVINPVRLSGSVLITRRWRLLSRDPLSRNVFTVEPETGADVTETGADVTDSSLPACICLDGSHPLQDHGHPQPDAPPGEAQTASQVCRRHVRPSPAEGRGPEDHDPKAQEAQLCQQEVRASASVQREGGSGVHPRRGTQPAGAQRGAGGGREDAGPARRQTQSGPRKI